MSDGVVRVWSTNPTFSITQFYHLHTPINKRKDTTPPANIGSKVNPIERKKRRDSEAFELVAAPSQNTRNEVENLHVDSHEKSDRLDPASQNSFKVTNTSTSKFSNIVIVNSSENYSSNFSDKSTNATTNHDQLTPETASPVSLTTLKVSVSSPKRFESSQKILSEMQGSNKSNLHVSHPKIRLTYKNESELTQQKTIHVLPTAHDANETNNSYPLKINFNPTNPKGKSSTDSSLLVSQLVKLKKTVRADFDSGKQESPAIAKFNLDIANGDHHTTIEKEHELPVINHPKFLNRNLTTPSFLEDTSNSQQGTESTSTVKPNLKVQIMSPDPLDVTEPAVKFFNKTTPQSSDKISTGSKTKVSSADFSDFHTHPRTLPLTSNLSSPKETSKRIPEKLLRGRTSEKHYATRQCVISDAGETKWLPPVVDHCQKMAVSQAETTSQDIAALTASTDAISSKEFTNTVKDLAYLVDFAARDETIAKNLVTSISNLMHVDNSVLQDIDKVKGESEKDSVSKYGVTSDIISSIDKFAETVELDEGEEITVA